MVTLFLQRGHAQYLTGPVASGAGGAGRASVEDAQQFFLNPATTVHGSPFSSGLFYQDGYTAKDEHDNWWGVALTDNSPDIFFSGAYAYVKRHRTFALLPTLDDEYHQASFATFILKHFSVGAAVTYLHTRVVGDKDYDQWDGHLGFHYNPDPDFGVGLVFYNIGPRELNVPKWMQNLDKVAVGSYYIFTRNFRGRLDVGEQLVANPDHHLDYQMGLESKFSSYLIMRLGFERDELADRHFYTAGLTFDGPRIKVDYFYRKNSDYTQGALHGVDLRLPFW